MHRLLTWIITILSKIWERARYFEDKSGNLSLQEVLAAYETGQFHNGKTDILNFGNTRSAVWLNVTFRPSHKLEDYLVIGGATLGKLIATCHPVRAGNSFRPVLSERLLKRHTAPIFMFLPFRQRWILLLYKVSGSK